MDQEPLQETPRRMAVLSDQIPARCGRGRITDRVKHFPGSGNASKSLAGSPVRIINNSGGTTYAPHSCAHRCQRT